MTQSSLTADAKICYVQIKCDSKQCDNSVTQDGWSDLKIDGKEIVFLQEPLLEKFSAKVKKDGIEEKWCLTFFRNTQYQVILYVSLSDKKPERPSKVRAIWQVCNNVPSSQQIEEASYWLRSSKTFSLDKYMENGGRWFAMDGAGLSMISPSMQESTFRRAVILLALAYAYRLCIEKLINELSKVDEHTLLVSKLARCASEFNACCYFRFPVKPEHNALVDLWEAIATRLHIPEMNHELIEQARQLHELVDAEKQRLEQRRWQILGLLLSLISALQVLSLFSEETRRQWWATLSRWFGL